MESVSRKSSPLAALKAPLMSLARALALLLVVQTIFTWAADDQLAKLIVIFFPSAILVLFGLTTLRIARKSSFLFLTPVPFFFAWSAIVFGIGPLYHWLAPPEAARVSTAIFSSNPIDHAWVALTNSCGLFFTLIGFMAALDYIISRQRLQPPIMDLFAPMCGFIRAGYSALALAIIIRLLEFLFGLDIKLPGFLSFTDRAGWVGILLLSIAGANAKKNSLLAISALAAAAEFIFGLVIGIRTEAVTPIAFWFVGCFVGSRSTKVLVTGFASIAAVLLFVTPLVKEIRQITWGGSFQGSSISALNTAVERQVLEDGSSDPALYAIWKRLDYSPWQAEMMRLYDTGSPGDTYQYIYWTFIPRFLVPSKPVLEIGDDIGYAVQGVSQSSSFSGTVFGEMYWNGGWIALLLSSLAYGIFLCFVASTTLWLFVQNRLAAVLIGSTGILYGFVVDETFSVSIVGQAIIFFFVVYAYKWGSRFFTFRARR